VHWRVIRTSVLPFPCPYEIDHDPQGTHNRTRILRCSAQQVLFLIVALHFHPLLAGFRTGIAPVIGSMGRVRPILMRTLQNDMI
jgi:hypothetical protein